MTITELKKAKREYFGQMMFARLWFDMKELGHSAVNVPRETLRGLGAPDAPAGKRNWADNLSILFVAAVCLGFIFAVAVHGLG